MNLSTIRKNYMQNAAETRKLYAKYNDYAQKIQILKQYPKHKFQHNTQNTNFITMQKIQIFKKCTKHKFYHNAKDKNFLTMQKTQLLQQYK